MSETTQGYRDLIAWQKAMELVEQVYPLVKCLPADERCALSSQIWEAVIAVPANLAAGQARQHAREFLQFLSSARGSLAEVDTLLSASQRLGYLTLAELAPIEERIIELRRILQGRMHSVQTRREQRVNRGS